MTWTLKNANVSIVFLEEVLSEMPPLIHQLLEEVPLVVEDHPSREVMREMEIEHRDELCGLYSGVPIGDKHIDHPMPLPDMVTIFREGIMAQAFDEAGRRSRSALKKEIRITILHELAHHHGMDEEELDRLGYG